MLLLPLRELVNDTLEVLLQLLYDRLHFTAFALRPLVKLLRRHHLAVFGGRQRETERRAQKHDVFPGGLVAQCGKRFALLVLEGLINGAATGLVVLALEYRRQRRIEVVNQLVHCLLKSAGAARGKFDGDRLVGIDEIIDIDPIRRARLRRRLFGQHGLDRVLHTRAMRADDEQVEAGLINTCTEADSLEGALLSDQTVDRFKLRGRRESQIGEVGCPVKRVCRKRSCDLAGSCIGVTHVILLRG